MRGGWAVVLMAGLGSDAIAQREAMPALSIQGIARAHILCLVDDRSSQRLALQARLAEQVRRIAAKGATVPVDVIGFGDPALFERDALGVLVHVAIDRSDAARPLAVVSIRPHRAEATLTPLFGARPVAVALDKNGGLPDSALIAALDQVLPWRMAAAHRM